ncbi:glycosyltransferase family 4 protein [Amycolatopsis sp. YIM 10]|uniref:glycosyltransferase family 4 protein n=1 Tax=Amycolatopsis sp. YIM 10 TaxID=2653857 RepID=UPI00128FDFEF|nr:glycosyltransferase family 4 protein [Amycolatopsis sp. YIM 10]QFU91659.1 D-inositol 3-phosphate glycosyltransferase [Amycolatopsis sp. YIM 10]
MTDDRPLRVALLSYRGKPTCGGQGVYVRHLSRALADLGHEVEVIGGPPYPVLGDGVRFTPLPGLDLYADENPFRTPQPRELRSLPALIEYAGLKRGRFTEPLAFSLRARHYLRGHAFDVIHDNQGLGYGLLGLPGLVATIHHPVAIDRAWELDGASPQRQREVLAWYRFLDMQRRVARRIPQLIAPAAAGAGATSAWLGIPPERITITPLGVDTAVFRPDRSTGRVPGRIVTTASADAPIKGLADLLTAAAALRPGWRGELHVVGTLRPGGPAARQIARLGLPVRFHRGLTDAQLADLISSAEVACVPSRYEGFSLPALEAMACGTPLVCTTAGALPEVTGPDGHAALHAAPGDPAALTRALRTLLSDTALRRRLGAAGVTRAARFTWRATAEATVAAYRSHLRPAVLSAC